MNDCSDILSQNNRIAFNDLASCIHIYIYIVCLGADDLGTPQVATKSDKHGLLFLSYYLSCNEISYYLYDFLSNFNKEARKKKKQKQKSEDINGSGIM